MVQTAPVYDLGVEKALHRFEVHAASASILLGYLAERRTRWWNHIYTNTFPIPHSTKTLTPCLSFPFRRARYRKRPNSSAENERWLATSRCQCRTSSYGCALGQSLRQKMSF